MAADPRRPFSVVLCDLMIRVAAQLVPVAQQKEWKQEWLAEIWHRWQFLLHAGIWSRREAFRLIRNCVGAFPDAAWHFASQDAVQTRLREWARSPWSYLAGIAACLMAVVLLSEGLPATRDLLRPEQSSSRLLFMWLHPMIGGGDRGLPPDVVPGWASHSRLLEGVAPFSIRRIRVEAPGWGTAKPIDIATQRSLFEVLRAHAQIGSLKEEAGVVLDHRLWVSVFHRDSKILGSKIRIGQCFYPIRAVLPASFRFLSRRPSIYVLEPVMADSNVLVVARARPGVTEHNLDRELTKISENVSYYFFNSQLRIQFLNTALWTPARMFLMAVIVSSVFSCLVCRVHVRRLRFAFQPENRLGTVRRVCFCAGKLTLALATIFTAGLEWTRSESSILFASRDPASGPLLVWLYILGTMGVFFWSIADQRARCRVCLRLLCFPVRIGCPGCLLLDWSGTELLCTEGHGVLHVPHLAPSWDEEAEHWISLDESWRDLFAPLK
jgi:hypothetical protein